MPITQFFAGSSFGPETKRVMGVAFEKAREALQLGDRGNLANERIAKKIIELAKAGELNPDLLCESVLREFRRRAPQIDVVRRDAAGRLRVNSS